MAFDHGYVQVYTGNGKGKTTASLGLAMRAAGAGLRVLMIQFMKGRRYSEIEIADLIPNFEIHQHGRDEFVSREDPERIDIDLARKGMEHAEMVIMSGNYDVVILDEINVAVDFGLLNVTEVLELVRNRPENVELVLTGRNAHPEMIKEADLVTEMVEIKHFYESGVEARPGIEY
jgi:cob(I)alamin adenosyltransferase